MNKQNRSAGRLALIVTGCVLSLAAQNAAAEATFACHVLTKDDRPGVVFVQTDAKAKAQQVALGARVDAGRRAKEPVVKVVECINYPQGRFSDYVMQTHLKKIPR